MLSTQITFTHHYVIKKVPYRPYRDKMIRLQRFSKYLINIEQRIAST